MKTYRFAVLSIVLVSVLFLSSCISKTELPRDWYPLTHVVERPSISGVNGTTVTTISPFLYTSDLKWFWETYPAGSVQHEALRRHETTHAIRQETYSSKILWINRYLTDKKFKLQEEKLGYKASIRYYLEKGFSVNTDAIATVLSSKTYGNMMSFQEARQWADKVVSDFHAGK